MKECDICFYFYEEKERRESFLEAEQKEEKMMEKK